VVNHSLPKSKTVEIPKDQEKHQKEIAKPVSVIPMPIKREFIQTS
jgi:hypothetical protein